MRCFKVDASAPDGVISPVPHPSYDRVQEQAAHSQEPLMTNRRAFGALVAGRLATPNARGVNT
jgi:hypothetical protein